jgi:choline transport protein
LDLAFNALLGSSVVLQQISFIIPAMLLIYQRRSEAYLPKNRAFALPSWLGWTTNMIVVVFASILSIFFLFPPFLPVTGTNMSELYPDFLFLINLRNLQKI